MGRDAGSGGSGADDTLLPAVAEAIGHRPAGYRRMGAGPRRQLRRRLEQLGLDVDAYIALVEADAAEQAVAERLLAVTCTRFFRDRAVWSYLRATVVPALAGDRHLRIWCAGAGGGEEAMSFAMLLAERAVLASAAEPRIVATDLREDCVLRARAAVYGASSVRDVPADLGAGNLSRSGEEWTVTAPARDLVAVATHDLWRDPWPNQVSLVAMRNVVFTYWGSARQEVALERLRESLRPHGWLVIGAHETLPPSASEWLAPVADLPIYRRLD